MIFCRWLEMCLWSDAGKLGCLVGGLHILFCFIHYNQGHTFFSCNNDVVLVFPEIFKYSMFCFGDICMYWFIGVGVMNFIDIMIEATAVNIFEFTCLDSCHSSSGDVFFDGVKTFLQVLVIPMFTPFKLQDNWNFRCPASKKHIGK